MNWDTIGAIGEIFGVITVVATLGYLAIQIRLSRQATDANKGVPVPMESEFYKRW